MGLLMLQTYFLGKFKAMDKFMDQNTKLIGLKKTEDNYEFFRDGLFVSDVQL